MRGAILKFDNDAQNSYIVLLKSAVIQTAEAEKDDSSPAEQ